MRYLPLLLLLLSLPAYGQDFTVVPVAGDYLLKASWDSTDYAQVCFFRTDTGADLACVATPIIDPASPTGQRVETTVTISNPGTDVDIRAYALDISGNRSNDSANQATADFTPPAAPEMLP